MECINCRGTSNLYEPITGYKVQKHITHSETKGNTTTNYHSIDKIDPIDICICINCVAKRERKGIIGLFLINLFGVAILICSYLLFVNGIIWFEILGLLLGLGGSCIFFTFLPIVKRLKAGSNKRKMFYFWEIAGERKNGGISSPGVIRDLKEGKIDFSNSRELK